jgi:hypothetical protein
MVWLERVFGIPSESEREYARPERLADVMALIQVLALDEDAHRTEKGRHQELQGPPCSAATEHGHLLLKSTQSYI